MADQVQKGPARPAGTPEMQEEQDVLFRAQMSVMQIVLGYWRHALAVTGAVLLVVLIVGLVRDYRVEQQQEWQAAIASVDVELPAPDPLAQYGLAPLDDPNDKEKMDKLAASAAGYEAVAGEASGASAVIAWMRAAETWERAGQKDKVEAAYRKATELGAPGALGWAARASLAATLASKGDVDGAAALYREAANGKDFYAERALFELGGLYAGAGRREDAGKAYEEFNGRFADSTLADEVAAARGQLVGGGS